MDSVFTLSTRDGRRTTRNNKQGINFLNIMAAHELAIRTRMIPMEIHQMGVERGGRGDLLPRDSIELPRLKRTAAPTIGALGCANKVVSNIS